MKSNYPKPGYRDEWWDLPAMILIVLAFMFIVGNGLAAGQDWAKAQQQDAKWRDR